MEDTLDKGRAKGRFDPREVRAANCLLRGIGNAERPTSLSQASQPPVASDSRFNWTSTNGENLLLPHLSSFVQHGPALLCPPQWPLAQRSLH